MKIIRAVLILLFASLFAGCSVPQLDYLGITDPVLRETLLALPDEPMRVENVTVHPDGSVVLNPCEAIPASYRLLDPGPAMQAFRAVTCLRGWTNADTQAWAPFAEAVMKRESKFCPGLFYAGKANAECFVYKQGHGSAAGFAQVILRHAPYLCPNEGLCSKWDIIASPTNSMTAFVALIEHSGRQPWCYTAALRRGYICNIAPR